MACPQIQYALQAPRAVRMGACEAIRSSQSGAGNFAGCWPLGPCWRSYWPITKCGGTNSRPGSWLGIRPIHFSSGETPATRGIPCCGTCSCCPWLEADSLLHPCRPCTGSWPFSPPPFYFSAGRHPAGSGWLQFSGISRSMSTGFSAETTRLPCSLCWRPRGQSRGVDPILQGARPR